MIDKATQHKAPVIDLFSKRRREPLKTQRIIRLSPEYDGLCMLYSNDANPDKVFKLKVLGWGLRADGEVVGLVPWLDRITPCTDLSDPLNGHWEGYYNPSNGLVFYEPPAYKHDELEAAHAFHTRNHRLTAVPTQEIPDTIGTHAAFADKPRRTLFVSAVLSWRLQQDGQIEGMIIDPAKVKQTPVLAGDFALYPVTRDERFKYYFQYGIANKIKTHDPEAINAISALIKL